MDRESVESRMKSEVARYIYEKRLCPIHRPFNFPETPTPAAGEWECVE